MKNKIILILITIIMVASPLKNASAQVVSVDPTNLVPNVMQTLTGSGSLALKLKDVAIEILKTVAKRLAQKALTKITESTVNWINSGMPSGGPLFVDDPKGFFGNLNNESVSLVVNDLKTTPSAVQPYARDIAISLIKSNSSGYSNASTLNEAIGQGLPKDTESDGTSVNGKIGGDGGAGTGTENIEKFTNDFSQGGWGGWLALTQTDSNNIIGATFKEQDRLANKISKKNTETQSQLNQGSGFLPVTSCADPEYQDPVNYPQPVEEDYVTEETDDNGYPVTVFNREAYNEALKLWQSKTTCNKTTTETPGKLAAESITQAMGSKVRQTEYSQAFGSSLSAIFDALMNQFMDKGLSGLAKGSNSRTGTGESPNQFTYNGNTITIGEDTATDWRDVTDQNIDIESILLGSKNENNDGIRDGSVVTYVQSYIALLKDEMTTYNNLPQKLKTLDSCIPGPDQGWEQRLKDMALEQTSKLQGYSGFGEEDKDLKVKNYKKYLPEVIRDIKGKKIGTIPDEWPMPSFYDFVDTINASKKMGVDMQLLTDKYITMRSVAMRLEKLKLDFENNPSPEKIKEIVTKYLAIKDQIPVQDTFDIEQGDLDKVKLYESQVEEQTVTCNDELSKIKPFYRDHVLSDIGEDGGKCYAYDGKTIGIDPVPNPDGSTKYIPATPQNCRYNYFCEVPFNYATPFVFQGNGLGWRGPNTGGIFQGKPMSSWESTFYVDCQAVYDADTEDYSMQNVR